MSVEIERVEKRQRDYVQLRERLQSAAPGAIPICRYLVVDRQGNIALAGHCELQSGGTFLVDAARNLGPGKYSAIVGLHVGGNVVGSDMREVELDIGRDVEEAGSPAPRMEARPGAQRYEGARQKC